MTPPDQLRCRLGTVFPTRPAENIVRRDRLVMGTPTMLWPTWSLRLCPPSLFQRGARLALSAAVLLVGTPVAVGQAAALLGGQASGPQVVTVLWQLTKTDYWHQIRSALIQLADHLDAHPPPIDYQRRRHLDYTGLLPETAWSGICRCSGTRPEGASTARRYLRERLSTLPAFANPLLPDEAAAAASLALFPTRLTPELKAALDEYALTFLAEQGISDEPVHWQPPTELLDGLRLPGADITNVDVPEVHRLIRQQQLPPGVAAKQFSVSVDAIRVTLEEHPAPRQPRRPPAPSTTVRRAGPAYQKASLALPRSRFVELYEHQHASLRHIAAMIGVSKQTVTELARDYRIPLRRPQSPRKYTFDRDWLYREHVIKGRPLAELAREQRCQRSNHDQERQAAQYPGSPTWPPHPRCAQQRPEHPIRPQARTGRARGMGTSATPRRDRSIPYPSGRRSAPQYPPNHARSPGRPDRTRPRQCRARPR